MTDVIETRDLTKLYGTGKGCRNISLSVGPGQVFGFLGPNGAGKSTFIKMLVGLLQPTAGKAQILGLPLGHLEARRKIGYLPELFRYQDWLTGEEVLRFHAKLGKFPSNRIDKRITEVLYEVGLEGRGKERVKHYSKGMQQRLGLATALLLDPSLIFLDEPSSALDPVGRFEVRNLLIKLREQGKTVFLNTHLLEDVEAVCDHVALLFHGQIRQIGTVHEIIRPTPVWELKVGGFLPELLASIAALTLIPVSLKSVNSDGSAVLHASAAESEQIGWLNHLLFEQGLTLYEVRPLQTRLEEWFLALAAEESGTPA
ncbi:MAG: transporter related protein [Bacilli bacterium]|nr:transporter related protein [Bacilli bacterium]